MKIFPISILILWLCVLQAFGQKTPISITTHKSISKAERDHSGSVKITISAKELKKARKAGKITYKQLGAKGDGKTNDLVAIVATHEVANQYKLDVEADQDASFYIGPEDLTATIRTNTDFKNAHFIIDDTNVENRNSPIFAVTSNFEAVPLTGITRLKRNQARIDAKLPGPSIITVTNKNVKHYIRFGLNQNKGANQTDIFVVDAQGNVDQNAPIIWDFNHISDIVALPIDQDTLTIKGGKFTTIANQAESKYTYYARGFSIRRSHVLVDGLKHYITGEGEHGAPYGGFLTINNCAYVTVMNTVFTGHKTYRTIGAAGKPVSMGSYDLSINRALNVSIINCTQTNDILDNKYWGILGSNYSKNLLYDNCTLSRFDAHQGVANATIRNSTLGHMGINAIGSGTFLVENSTIHSRQLINLRSDYGSTWEGTFIIRNCTLAPAATPINDLAIFNGSYDGNHDFGYTCHMPERIIIENLQIKDGNHSANYKGPTIFSNMNPKMTDHTYQEKYPYIKTKEVVLNNIVTESQKEVRVSNNTYMFKDVRITKK